MEIARIAKPWCILGVSAPDKRRGVSVTVSTSGLCPNPPAFRWEAQITKEEYERRVHAAAGTILRLRRYRIKWHDSDTSTLEAVLSRGDRRIGRVLEAAWRQGPKWMPSGIITIWISGWLLLRTAGLIRLYANRVRPGRRDPALVDDFFRRFAEVPVGGTPARL